MTMIDFLNGLEIYSKYFSPEELDFFEELKEKQREISKNMFTENGKKILKCMKDYNEKYSNVFNSKQLGELLFMPPRSVSGAMKKLLNDGYVEKKATNPVSYSLTSLGEETQID